MKYLSVCSGIEAATVAWHKLGFKPVGFSEIEKFPSQVLTHHYPDVNNYGDMTKYKEWDIGTIDILVGGTPCQSFSVAGLRQGMQDPRGNLALTYCGILDRFKPKWFVWENVPGVLSSNGGRDFGSFLRAVAEFGYGFAYRVLDAQNFGVPQRRRRVFVVGCLGDWKRAATVLFERESLCWDIKTSRKKGQDVAACASSSTSVSVNNQEECVVTCFEQRSPDGIARVVGGISPTLNRMGGGQREPCVFYNNVFATLDANEGNKWGSNQWVDQGKAILQPISLAENTIGRQPQNGGNGDGFTVGGPMYTLNATGVHGVAQPIPLDLRNATQSKIIHGTQDPCVPDIAFAQGRNNGAENVLVQSMSVRRLTPVECERLQGFPDGYTDIQPNGKPTADGSRYKALGNSMAVPVMKWIGERIKQVDLIKVQT
jgi:DNA (cytosine-5)-methyltransferase 1